MRMREILVAGTMLAGLGGAVALAQGGATYDPAQLPATQGKVAQYSLTPRGDVDGLILQDGTEVHLPPHLGAQLVFAVKPGDSVTVHGLKARAAAMIQAMSVTNDASKQTVVDSGPPGGPRGRGPMEGAMTAMSAQGTVKTQLHSPRGDLNGVLLEDGTIVRLPPPEAQRLAADLAVGQTLVVQGDGVASPLGRVIMARQLGPDATKLAQVQLPPHGGWMGRHGPKHGGPGGDMPDMPAPPPGQN